MSYFKKTYIPLGRRVSPQTQDRLERTIPKVLMPVNPSEIFISELESDLIAAAKQQYREQAQFWRGMRTVGMIGGGLLSIVGGVFMWMRLRQRRELSDDTQAFSSPQLVEIRI